MTRGLKYKVTDPKRTQCVCIDVKSLLSEKGVVRLELRFLFIRPGSPSAGMMGQVAGATTGPARGALTGAEICVCQALFGFRAFAHLVSLFH